MSEGGAAFLTLNEFTSRDLSEDEANDITELLEAAGSWIRRNAPHLADGDRNARFVSIEVVKTALATADLAGHTSYSKAVGPRSKSGTLAAPGGALVFTDWHKSLLGISVNPTPSFHFGDDPC